jgi:hypothetical protein
MFPPRQALLILGVALSESGAAAAPATPPASQQIASDSVRDAYRNELAMLRDSVSAVRAALGQFQRDLGVAGGATVLSRATHLAGRCRGLRTVTESAGRVLTPRASWTPALRERHRELEARRRELSAALVEHCEQGLGPTGPGERADTIKAWAPHRTSRLSRALTAFERAITRFAQALG